MSNQITASIDFYFKAEKFSASVTLDLDLILQKNQDLPNFYPLLAKSINIDIYSYEYEMMQAEEVKFSHINNEAGNYVTNNIFDFDAYKKSWQSNQLNISLSEIALKHLGIADLESETRLKLALLETYNLGLRNNKTI